MTRSILARDPTTGALGVAVASRFFAVGALLHMLDAQGRGSQHTGPDCVSRYGTLDRTVIDEAIAREGMAG